MRHRISTIALASVLAIAACSREAAGPLSITPDALSPSLSLQSESSTGVAGDTYLVRFSGAVSAAFVQKVAQLGGHIVFAHAGAKIGAVEGLDDAGAAELATVAGVAAVIPDAFTTIDDPTTMDVDAADVPASPTNPTTAFFYPRQWNMGVVKADLAWAAGNFGSATTKVGILDTGLDYLHPDLYGRVDLTLSRSFLSQAENDRVQAAYPGAHPVADIHYHGTHVGATVTSNGLAAAGINSKVTLVGLKVCFPNAVFNGVCPTSGTLQAILYAADNRIPVINMSLGGTFSRKNGILPLPVTSPNDVVPLATTIEFVMTYANRRGTTVVVSAGNSRIDMDKNDPDQYVSYCDAPYVICVSATGPTSAQLFDPDGSAGPQPARYINVVNIDALASYSNFGSNVDVAAPGGNAIPVWAACSGFTLHPSLGGCRTRFYNPETGGWSASVLGISGTSMASPHVAGLAALSLSSSQAVTAQYNPPLVERVLEQGADDLGATGFDPIYGNGRINVPKTLAGLKLGKVAN